MDRHTWKNLDRALRDPDKAVDAARELHEKATAEDVPRLLQMLEDDDFFVREAAALPLTQLAGLAVLPQLLAALQRTFDDGHDGDGFQAALFDLVEADKPAARQALTPLLKHRDKAMRENAQWLLEFCDPAPGG